jgi:hypothetical protein
MESGHVLAVQQRGQTVYDRMKVRKEVPADPQDAADFPHGIDRDLDLLGERVVEAFGGQRGEPVTLPEERAGLLLVFRPFDQVSYALVMRAERAIHVQDVVTNP